VREEEAKEEAEVLTSQDRHEHWLLYGSIGGDDDDDDTQASQPSCATFILSTTTTTDSLTIPKGSIQQMALDLLSLMSLNPVMDGLQTE